MARTPKVKMLRDSLRENGWHITAFPFYYNHFQYTVLFEDSKALGYNDQYVIAILTFIDDEDENRRLTVEANMQGFDGVPSHEIMDYFRIQNYPSAKGFFPGFYSTFNEAMPDTYQAPQNRRIRDLCVVQLAERDNAPDPLAFLCFDARRNPVVEGKQRHRSPFNTDKTKLLRKELFDLLGKDDTISFFYSRDKKASDAEILRRFRERENTLL